MTSVRRSRGSTIPGSCSSTRLANPLLNTGRPFGAALPVLRNEQTFRALDEGKPQVSNLFLGRTTGRFQVATYMPVIRSDGTRFVLAMGLKIEDVSRVLTNEKMPDSWTATIADRTGTILGRSRALDKFSGTPLGTFLRTQIAGSKMGSFVGTNQEGTRVFGAYVTSTVSGWTVALGIPFAEVNAPLIKSVSTTGLVALLLLAVGAIAAAVMGRRITRSLRELCEAALGVARGETPRTTPSSIAEINEVADSLETAGAVVGQRSKERDQAEVELDRRTRTLSMLVENLPIAVSLTGPDRCYLAFNRLFLEQQDLTPDQLRIGDPFEKFARHVARRGDYGPGDVETLVQQRLARLDRHAPEHFEITGANGRILDVHIVPLPDGGLITARMDVTERRRRELEIEQARARLEQRTVELNAARVEAERARITADAANTAKSLFLANMSHELRTPLNAIIGFSEIIASSHLGPLDVRYEQYGHDVNAAGQHLLRLINDLLDQARLEVGQLELHDDLFQIDVAMEECRHLLSIGAEERNVAVKTVAAPGLPRLRADRVRIKQILINLMSNAVKFTRPGGCVKTTARRTPDGGLALAVADNGIGMRPEDIPAALEPFRQIDNTFSRRYEGAGLGLSLAKALSRAHDGQLDIKSELGKGTLVTVWLPPSRLVQTLQDEAPVRSVG